MRVLFLLSALEPAGSETYGVSLMTAWRGRHEVFWISDRVHNGQPYTAMPIRAPAFPGGLVNAARVAAFARRRKIDVIHSLTRRAQRVGALAAAWARIPHVTTIRHLPARRGLTRVFPCLGDAAIAVDEAVADRLRRHFRYPRERLHLIRNGIDLDRFAPSLRHAANVKQVLVIGRWSGGGWPVLQFFFDVLQRAAPTLPTARYRIVGGIPDPRREALINQLSKVGSRIAPSTVETLGAVPDLGNVMRNSDAVIAAGRSALESLASGRVTLLMGEGGVLGVCRPEIWPDAMRSSMGDHLEPTAFVPATLELALRELLSPRSDQGETARWARAQVEKNYDARLIAAQVEAVYRRAAGAR